MAQGGSNSLESMLANYTTPMPSIVNQYEQNITKGKFLDMPSFQEMFGSFQKLGQREADRQAASMNEAFGSQGARYSSDLLASGSRLKENLFDQLTNKAAEYQLGLRQQQSKEVGAIANMQYGASEAGMTRYFQDFLRRTSPPPGAGDPAGLSAGYGLPAYIA